jgi:transcriptional antiterminator NusG
MPKKNIEEPKTEEIAEIKEIAEEVKEETEPEKPLKPESDAPWYVIHTYAGYEDSVAKSLRQRAHSLNMEDKIFEVLVPTEKQIRIRGGKRKVIEEKIFPGYVLVQMIVTEESWYIVRNTPNVTGFVGTETTPIPLSEAEVKTLKKRMGKKEPDYDIDIAVGDAVKVVDGPFKNFDGKVEVVDREKGKIKVLVNMFSRETPVELDFLQVKKV